MEDYKIADTLRFGELPEDFADKLVLAGRMPGMPVTAVILYDNSKTVNRKGWGRPLSEYNGKKSFLK